MAGERIVKAKNTHTTTITLNESELEFLIVGLKIATKQIRPIGERQKLGVFSLNSLKDTLVELRNDDVAIADNKETPISELNLFSQTHNALIYNEIHTIQQLQSLSIIALMKMPHIGKMSINSIEKAMEEYGIDFK